MLENPKHIDIWKDVQEKAESQKKQFRKEKGDLTINNSPKYYENFINTFDHLEKMDNTLEIYCQTRLDQVETKTWIRFLPTKAIGSLAKNLPTENCHIHNGCWAPQNIANINPISYKYSIVDKKGFLPNTFF